MFGLFKKRPPKPRPPAFKVWSGDAVRWSGIWSAVTGHTGEQRVVLVAHFDETLWIIRSLLDKDALPYTVLQTPQSPELLARLPAGLSVVRSDCLQFDESATPIDCKQPLRLLAVELHFLPEPDSDLRRFAETLQGEFRYEHHASLEDKVMTMFAGARTLKLLQAAGFKDGDCLESPMVSSGISRAQTKIRLMLEASGKTPDLHNMQPFIEVLEQAQSA